MELPRGLRTGGDKKARSRDRKEIVYFWESMSASSGRHLWPPPGGALRTGCPKPPPGRPAGEQRTAAQAWAQRDGR